MNDTLVSTDPGWLPSTWAAHATTLALVMLPFILTWAFTASSHIGSGNGDVRQPPKIPYWIPLVGNTIAFAYNTEDFLKTVVSKFGKIPLRMYVGAETMYFIPHGTPILDLFKASRYVTTKPLGVMTVRDAFGCPPEDMPIYSGDDSGTEAKPAPGWEDFDPAKRLFFPQHRDFATMLTGVSLNVMTDKFVEVYTRNIEQDPRFVGEEWAEIDDLYAYLKNGLIRAAIEALCGERFFELSPDFPEVFWHFDKHLPTLFKRVPKWLAPSSYRARDKALEGVMRYHEYGRKLLESADNEISEKEWTPEFGAKLMYSRLRMIQNLGFGVRGAAALDLGMLWAVNANAIPAAMWMLLDILRDTQSGQNLHQRVLAEVEPCFHPGSLSFDIDNLCSRPLLNSIYLETLRLRVASAIGRSSLVPNLKLGQWQLKQNVTMMASSWTGGHDPDFWNVGKTVDGTIKHPVDTFWAERFLEYPDDPSSGPVRKDNIPSGTTSRTPKDDRTAKATTEGTQGYYYPYGGGTKMCPGRFFAKQELMAGVAVVLRAFDIELLDRDAAAKVEPNMEYFPFGTIPPKGKLRARLRRRKL